MDDFKSLRDWKGQQSGVVVLYPGGFKPLTGGHLSLIEKYASLPEVKEVRLLVGPKPRNGISQDTAVEIANEFLKDNPKVTVHPSKYPSPVLTAYKAVEEATPGSYTLASSNKGNDWERTKSFIEQHQPGGKYNEKLGQGVDIVALPVDPEPAIYSGRSDEHEGAPISASILRKDIMDGNESDFDTNYPNEDPRAIAHVWDMLQGKLTESTENYSRVYPYQHYRSQFPIIPLTEEDEDMETLEESVTPKVNKHMTHAEDLVVLGGEDGFSWVLGVFSDLYDQLKGFTPKNEIRLSVKIDGAPAIFAWNEFPGLEKNGIATKGLFAKNPKVLYSPGDIDEMYGDKGQLVYKLKSFLKHLKSLQIPKGEIWQGDFLFDDKSLGQTEIDGDDYYVFHPNTIYYAVPKDSDLAKDISAADVGIVWHTKYLGDDLNSVQASYDADVTELKTNSKVFMTDPYVKSLAGIVNFTEEESDEVEDALKTLTELEQAISENSSLYSSIISNKDLISLLTIFWNSIIRAGGKFAEGEGFIYEFIEFIQNRFLKEEEKRKSEKGKANIRKKAEDLVLFIEENKEMLDLMVTSMHLLADLKKIFLKKMNQIGRFQTYLKMAKGGTRQTGQEGFAVSDINGNVVKMVDRKEFSWSNFSPDVLKGWS